MNFRFWEKKDPNPLRKPAQGERSSTLVIAVISIIAMVATIWVVVYALTR